MSRRDAHHRFPKKDLWERSPFHIFSCRWEEESTMRRFVVGLAASVVAMLGIVLAAQAGDSFQKGAAQKGNAAQKGGAVQKDCAAQKGPATCAPKKKFGCKLREKMSASKASTCSPKTSAPKTSAPKTSAPKKSREKLLCRAKTSAPKSCKLRDRAKTCAPATCGPSQKGSVQKGPAQKDVAQK